MDAATVERLRELGQRLDADNYPLVFNDGFVAPSEFGIDDPTLGAETLNEWQRERRSSAGSWQGSTGWQGSTRQSRSAGQPGPPGKAEPSGGRYLRENYVGQLDAVLAAYPRTAIWMSGEGMWLSVDSAVLAGLDRSATFLISVPFRFRCPIRAWAFWTWTVGFDWIGPRHTNAIDGSVCAFNPSEDTWHNGGSLVELIDHYTVWALRHLHLEKFGWWPGQQTAQFVHERLTELNDNEWCGCRRGAGRYHECCKQADLASDRLQAAIRFIGDFLKFKPRYPPGNIMRFLRTRVDPPAFRLVSPDLTVRHGSCLFPARNGTAPSRIAAHLLPAIGR